MGFDSSDSGLNHWFLRSLPYESRVHFYARFQGCSPGTPGNFEGVKSVKIVR